MLVVAMREVLRPDRAEAPVELADGLVHLGRADGEGRRDAEDVPVEPALADQEPALLGLLEQAAGRLRIRGTVLLRLVLDQLDALHQTHSAHVADRARVLLL